MERPLEELFIVVAASAFFLLMAVGIIVLFQVYTKRQLRMLLEKQALESRFQQELLSARLEAQEETMNLLSKELHDNIGQLLSSSKLLVGISKRTLPDSMETLIQADQTLGLAINELRAVSKSLNKEWLAQFNLVVNLTNEVNRINSTKEYTVSLKHPTEIKLPIERQLILFRIIQEAFQNCLKHAGASTISLAIEHITNELLVTVEDDGKGFNPEDASRHGIGIINIKQRTALLNGTVAWQSTPAGTLVIIKLPLINT